jgi:hypothetical protein
MSVLTFLVAESFLLVLATLAFVTIGKFAADKGTEIVTGIVRDIPASPRMREGMLFGVWLPWHAFNAAAAAVLAFTQLQMASYLTDANARAVAYVIAFLGVTVSAFTLVLLPIGLFSQRAKVRRDQRRQAEAR